MSKLCLPADYPRIKLVQSFEELMSTPFAEGINALCWERELEGDFSEIVRLLGAAEIEKLDESRLERLPVSAQGRLAMAHLVADLRMLRERGLDPVLDCIEDYPRDEEPEVVSTDVYSFHADSATVETDTFLCTYSGATSEGLRNDEAVRRVDVPQTRAELLQRYGGADDADFRIFLNECCFDLHYAALPGAKPFTFGVGNLWRIAVAYPECPVPPCIHRAPETLPGQPPRLLLIS